MKIIKYTIALILTVLTFPFWGLWFLLDFIIYEDINDGMAKDFLRKIWFYF